MELPTFNIRCLVPSADTGGTLAVFEEIDPPGQGPPLHVHREQSELFHVITGEFLFAVGDERLTLSAGGVALVPPGTAHAFKNVGDRDGVLHFELFPPGNAEEFFARLVAHDFDPAQMDAFFSDYGMDIAGPPL